EMTATVDAVDTAAGTITVLGQSIQVNNLTIMKDDEDANGQTPVRHFSLKNISPGDRVDIHAYAATSGGTLVATKLERVNASSPAIAQLDGKISQMGAGQLTISGITVDTSGVSTTSVSVGNQIQVSGNFSGGVLVATSLNKS
ncbi:MAG TPA: DUF5666 domain-containing protein, partial [Gammaproteobacteria bacterium]|nr:DUF5666 domain-containing protein [Gammaproteobacteria bacterium]